MGKGCGCNDRESGKAAAGGKQVREDVEVMEGKVVRLEDV